MSTTTNDVVAIPQDKTGAKLERSAINANVAAANALVLNTAPKVMELALFTLGAYATQAIENAELALYDFCNRLWDAGITPASIKADPELRADFYRMASADFDEKVLAAMADKNVPGDRKLTFRGTRGVQKSKRGWMQHAQKRGERKLKSFQRYVRTVHGLFLNDAGIMEVYTEKPKAVKGPDKAEPTATMAANCAGFVLKSRELILADEGFKEADWMKEAVNLFNAALDLLEANDVTAKTVVDNFKSDRA